MFASGLTREPRARVAALAFFVGISAAGCASAPGVPSAPIAAPKPSTGASAPAVQLGAQADSVRAVYGKPTFVRTEAGSELWRYDGEACSAFFFLYREGDAKTGPLTLKYVETSPKGASQPADAQCLSGIWQRAQAAS